jgi:hypothetical protein
VRACFIREIYIKRERERERKRESEKEGENQLKFVHAGSAITNRREPRSCLGRVFNSKLGCIATLGRKCIV